MPPASHFLSVYVAIIAAAALAAPRSGVATKRHYLSQGARREMHKRTSMPVLKSEIEALLLNEYPGLDKINALARVLNHIEVIPQETGIHDVKISHDFDTGEDLTFQTAVHFKKSGKLELVEPNVVPNRFGKGDGPYRKSSTSLDAFLERALAFVAPNDELASRILSEGPDAVKKLIWDELVETHPHWQGVVDHTILGDTRLLSSFGTEKVYLSNNQIGDHPTLVKTTVTTEGVPTSTFLQNNHFEDRIERILEQEMEEWALLATTMKGKLALQFPHFSFDFSTLSAELLESFKDGSVEPGKRNFWVSAKNKQGTEKLGVEVILARPVHGKANGIESDDFIATMTQTSEISDLREVSGSSPGKNQKKKRTPSSFAVPEGQKKSYRLPLRAREALRQKELTQAVESEIKKFLFSEYPGIESVTALSPLLNGIKIVPRDAAGIYDITVSHDFGTSSNFMFKTTLHIKSEGEAELVDPDPNRQTTTSLDNFLARALAYVAPNKELGSRILSEGPEVIQKIIWRGLLEKHPHWEGVVDHNILGETHLFQSYATEKVYLSKNGSKDNPILVKTTIDTSGVPTSSFYDNNPFEDRIESMLESKMADWARLSPTIKSKLIERFPDFKFDFSTISTELLESFADGTVKPGQRSLWISAKNKQGTQKLGVEVNLAIPPRDQTREAQASGDHFVATLTSTSEIVDLF